MAKLDTIPTGMKIIHVGGTNYYQKIKRSRKRFKTPKKVRDKISREARKFKLPVLTTASLGIGVGDAVQLGIEKKSFSTFGRVILRNYTGVTLNADNTYNKWDWKMAMKGTGTLLLTMGLAKLKIFRPVNRLLAKARVPVRMN